MAHLPFKQLSGTITMGKTRQLFSESVTARGTKAVVFTNESEALRLSCNVVSIDSNTQAYMEVYEISGDTEGHERRLMQSITCNDIGIRQETILVTGKIRIEIYYSGQVEFEMSATGVGAAATAASTVTTVKVQRSAEELSEIETLNTHLHEIKQLLTRILNHQRQITNLEPDLGDEF
jgi:hypothetical protein